MAKKDGTEKIVVTVAAREKASYSYADAPAHMFTCVGFARARV